MARKNIRFNYFEVQLVPAQQVLEYDLRGGENSTQQLPDIANPWDMSDLLEYLMVNRDSFSTAVPIDEEYAEIEKNTYIYEQRRNLYSFQVSKMRDKNIPAKKRIGEIKEEILLRNDEYIGEFTSVLYDNNIFALMVQSNFYGLTTKQLEHVLTELRFKYLNEIGRDETEQPLIVRLAPIIDNSKFESALRADYFRKIRIRASDAMLDATLSEDSLLSDVRRALMRSTGINIDLQVSIGRAERTASLDEEEARKVLRLFQSLPDGQKPNMEITMLEDDEAEIEVVNLIEPRMTDRISVEIEARQTIAHEYLHDCMIQKYDDRRTQIMRIVSPLN